MRACEIDLQVRVETQRPSQQERPLEQRQRSTAIELRKRAPAGGGKSFARACGELRIMLSELRLVLRRLLEVEADDLIHLDRAGALRSSCQTAMRSWRSARTRFGIVE